jgi:hypothetical protein
MTHKICIELFASCLCFVIFTVANRAQMILPLKRDRRACQELDFDAGFDQKLLLVLDIWSKA